MCWRCGATGHPYALYCATCSVLLEAPTPPTSSSVVKQPDGGAAVNQVSCDVVLKHQKKQNKNQLPTMTLSRLGIHLTPPPKRSRPRPLQSSTRRLSACTTHQPLTCGRERRRKCSISTGSSQPGATSRSQPLARAEVATAANANTNAVYRRLLMLASLAGASCVHRLLEEAVGSCLCTPAELHSEQRPLQGSAGRASHGPGTLPRRFSQSVF